MSEEGQRLESSENYQWSATDHPSPKKLWWAGASTAVFSAMAEAEMQFSLTRTASISRRGAKRKFSSF
jgi:hypothetical protein